MTSLSRGINLFRDRQSFENWGLPEAIQQDKVAGVSYATERHGSSGGWREHCNVEGRLDLCGVFCLNSCPGYLMRIVLAAVDVGVLLSGQQSFKPTPLQLDGCILSFCPRAI